TYHRCAFKYDYLKGIFIYLPTKIEEVFEFHWEVEESRQSIQGQIICPFQTVKSRRMRLPLSEKGPKSPWLSI
ncbi:hypothetical protein, partial [Brevibacillus invocatus]|uniref:hypothetical protein n=1 Tax=Brevibacillus invocatus TaxID=173959 RepID=UPI001C83F827